ncbi:MAG: hypothetical protein FWC95_03745 [Defluviitaleaceae bacterium]|nr:hypothetical protein [Defluviitaleaceae bacterium]
MFSMPMQHDCIGFTQSTLEGAGTSANHTHAERRDCTDCVYFSRRNCGHDTGYDDFLYQQPFI